MVSVYLVIEGLCLFSWQNSCLQVEGVDPVLSPVPRTLSHRPDQGLGGVTAISSLAHGCGSCPYVQGIDSSTDCLQMSLLLLWASCPACFPAHPNLPILAPWGFSSTALQNSLLLWFYLSGDCLTTNTSFIPFPSLDNLEFMQGCGSRKIQVQVQCLVRLWLRQAVFTQQ